MDVNAEFLIYEGTVCIFIRLWLFLTYLNSGNESGNTFCFATVFAHLRCHIQGIKCKMFLQPQQLEEEGASDASV